MSNHNYNGQIYGLYIESESVFEEYLDERGRDMEELRDRLYDSGAVFIDEDFEDVSIESAIDNSTFDYSNKPSEDVWILPLSKWPTLLKPAYSSENEIISELKINTVRSYRKITTITTILSMRRMLFGDKTMFVTKKVTK